MGMFLQVLVDELNWAVQIELLTQFLVFVLSFFLLPFYVSKRNESLFQANGLMICEMITLELGAK
jgi:high-affinity Fe2+/Pb2+ permease